MAVDNKRRMKIILGDTDVAFVFRKEGEIEASFPEITTDTVPDHVMAAIALSHALVDAEFLNSVRDRFVKHMRLARVNEACNDV